MPVLSAADATVSEELIKEIDSIKADTDSSNKVSYEPSAWTREGRVD